MPVYNNNAITLHYIILKHILCLQYIMQSTTDTNNNILRTKNKQIKQAINECTNWHSLKTYSFINLTFDNKFFRRLCYGYLCISRK